MSPDKFQAMREAVMEGIASGAIVASPSLIDASALQRQGRQKRKAPHKAKTIPRVCECGNTFFVRWPSDRQRICGHKCANTRQIERKQPKRRQVTAGRRPKALDYGEPVL